jgi:hypothetical protein
VIGGSGCAGLAGVLDGIDELGAQIARVAGGGGGAPSSAPAERRRPPASVVLLQQIQVGRAKGARTVTPRDGRGRECDA